MNNEAMPGAETTATLYASPDAPGGKHGVVFGTWRDAVYVEGFETALDAYYWCIQATNIDPLAGIPEQFRQWVHAKPADELDGLPLFAGEGA